MLWACQITRAKNSCGRSNSICTHCLPLRRKRMLWSDASLSPSVSLATLSAETFLSLHVTLLLGAIFLRPDGTIMGGRGLTGNGSTLGPSFRYLGGLLKADAGKSSMSGTIPFLASPEERLLAATIQSNWTITSSAVLINPRATAGAGGSIRNEVILRAVMPEILTLPRSSGTTKTGMVISFVTPATTSSPRESNSYWRTSLTLVAPFRVNSVERYSILGYCFDLRLSHMISSILPLYGWPSFSTLLSERTLMNTSA